MNYRILLFSLAITICSLTYAGRRIPGNAAALSGLSFTEAVNDTTFDRCGGCCIVGLDDALTGGAGDFAVSRLDRDGSAFVGVATNPLLNDNQINFVAHEKKRGKPASFFVAVDNAADGQTIAFSPNGTTVTQSVILGDAIGAATTAIVNLAAKDSQIFAIVEPAVGIFGAVNSGVAVANVTSGSLAQDAVNAQTGVSSGNTAQFLDSVVANTPAALIASDSAAMFTDTSIFYDEALNLLFFGLTIATGAAASDGIRTVIVSDVASSGLLTLRSIIPDALFIDGQITNVVGATRAGVFVVGKATHMGVMHASTGPSYLIVNGGCFVFPVVNNKASFISAVPLIDDPLSPAVHGTVANKDGALVNGKFVTVPTVNADLPAEGEPAVDVGGGTLPLTVLTGFTGSSVSDLKIVGDTVYVSVNVTNGPSDENGIFYSTALFDETGKIVRWTPWAKKAVPFDLFPVLVPATIPVAERGKVQFFEVDPVTADIMMVEGHDLRTVGTTFWSNAIGSLPTNVNTALTGASTAGLDLPRSTRGFATAAGDGRYALIGGDEQVVFAQLSEAKASATGAEDFVEDFTLPANLSNTTLPTGAGAVKHLEYSRRLGGTADSYFFAGTDTGLFVFADAGGAGFDVTATPPRDLDAAPFLGRTWQAAPNLDQTIIDIKTSGRQLYCITCVSRPNTRPEIKVLRIPFTTNISTMFASTNIFTLAQAGVGVFKDVPFFNGIEIIATDDPRITTSDDKEQLVLATSNGLLRSNATQAAAATGIIEATDQTTAAWQLVNATDNTFFFDTFGHDTPIRHTTWHISSTDNGTTIFDKNDIHQLSAAGTPGAGTPPLFPANFNPLNFRSLDASTVFGCTTFFWSDGGRRIITTFDETSSSQLQTIPFDRFRWCTSSPTQINDSALSSATHFNWMRQLHNGMLMVGTDEGVVALQ